MEQPCYKCGKAVEEGNPFCPHCSAPQIRVVIAEPPPSTSASADPASNLPGSAGLPASQTVPVLALPMQWSQALKPCALAALVAAVVVVLQLVVPLIAVFGAGFLAVVFYRRGAPGIPLRGPSGARLGVMSGFLCFGMTAVLGALRVVVLHEGHEIRRQLLDWIQQTAVRYPDPQYQPSLEFMRSPAGLVFIMAFILIFAFLTFLALGALGGAFGGVLLGRRDKT